MLKEASDFIYNFSNSYKSDSALRTIGEVSSELGIATHVLRFWESKFKQIKPQKRRGRRYYSQEDIKTLTQIKSLLYSQGFTIRGVQKFLTSGSNIKSFNNENKPSVLSAENNLTSLKQEENLSLSNETELLIIYNNLVNFRNKISNL